MAIWRLRDCIIALSTLELRDSEQKPARKTVVALKSQMSASCSFVWPLHLNLHIILSSSPCIDCNTMKAMKLSNQKVDFVRVRLHSMGVVKDNHNSIQDENPLHCCCIPPGRQQWEDAHDSDDHPQYSTEASFSFYNDRMWHDGVYKIHILFWWGSVFKSASQQTQAHVRGKIVWLSTKPLETIVDGNNFPVVLSPRCCSRNITPLNKMTKNPPPKPRYLRTSRFHNLIPWRNASWLQIVDVFEVIQIDKLSLAGLFVIQTFCKTVCVQLYFGILSNIWFASLIFYFLANGKNSRKSTYTHFILYITCGTESTQWLHKLLEVIRGVGCS